MSLKENTYHSSGHRQNNDGSDVDNFILDQVSGYKIRNKVEPAEVFSQISQKIARNQKKKLHHLYFSVSAAACIAIILGLFFYPLQHIRKYQTLTGEILELCLPDNSVVYLNENSKLSYNPEKWSKNREVELQGEAFFDVRKGSSFKVSTSKANVTVLGTSFNVKSGVGEERFQLDCYTGRVKVTENKSRKEVIVNPGEVAKLTKRNLQVEVFTLSGIPGWTNWAFNFKNQPLEVVFATIEHHYSIKIVHPKFSEKYFTGTIKSKDLETVMDVVCIPMGLDYKRLNNSIEVKFKN